MDTGPATEITLSIVDLEERTLIERVSAPNRWGKECEFGKKSFLRCVKRQERHSNELREE